MGSQKIVIRVVMRSGKRASHRAAETGDAGPGCSHDMNAAGSHGVLHMIAEGFGHFWRGIAVRYDHSRAE